MSKQFIALTWPSRTKCAPKGRQDRKVGALWQKGLYKKGRGKPSPRSHYVARFPFERGLKRRPRNAPGLRLIQFLHQLVGFEKDGDDLAVMRDVVVGKGAVFAVLKPLLGGLVAADVEIPG